MEQQILLIDDSPEIHTLVTTLLESEPVRVHSAYDGESGLILAQSLRPDLILLDVALPGKDGYEICRLLKESSNIFNTPVIFISARNGVEEKVYGLELGAVDYLSKPFDPAELIARVRSALRTQAFIRLLEEKAMLDSLTGLGNMNMFEHRLESEVALRIRTHQPLAVIAIDVDGFQEINDMFGHRFGDRALKAIAKIISTICRVEDVTCRLSGDAFAILTPNTKSEQAQLLGKRLFKALADLQLEHEGNAVRLKCSVAVAPSMDDYDRLMLERAHEVLDESRKEGAEGMSLAHAPGWAEVSTV